MKGMKIIAFSRHEIMNLESVGHGQILAPYDESNRSRAYVFSIDKSDISEQLKNKKVLIGSDKF